MLIVGLDAARCLSIANSFNPIHSSGVASILQIWKLKFKEVEVTELGRAQLLIQILNVSTNTADLHANPNVCTRLFLAFCIESRYPACIGFSGQRHGSLGLSDLTIHKLFLSTTITGWQILPVSTHTHSFLVSLSWCMFQCAPHTDSLAPKLPEEVVTECADRICGGSMLSFSRTDLLL